MPDPSPEDHSSDDTIRIFISSPGDVAQERVIAERAVERLQGEFARRATLDVIRWEREPLRATEHFQEQITPPAETDISIFILWSRLGTPLPEDKFQKESGEQYRSGTEWEFENAVQAYQEDGTPDLVTYRKTKDPEARLSDAEDVEQRLEQKRALESFVEQWFKGEEGESFQAAFHAFESPAEFEQMLETHLRKLIKEHLPERVTETTGATPKAHWHQGSPFRGLRPFEEEHAPIFFGRTAAVTQIIERLERQGEDGRPFVLVHGPSGTGKSSVVKAGVVPTLTRPGVIEGIGHWRQVTFRPSDAPEDLTGGFMQALFRAVPELQTTGFTQEELADLLRRTPEQAASPVRAALRNAAEATAEEEGLPEPPTSRVLLTIDQLEEIFTLGSVDADGRATFADAVRALTESGLVWTVASIRSDFFPRLSTVEALRDLKQGGGNYDLDPPSFAELGRMIRGPVRAAGLRFEEDPDRGLGLGEKLHESAAEAPEALPLLEFTLEELYRRRTDEDVLTFEAYEKLGGLTGAIAERAESVFTDLDPGVQAAFDEVMGELVTIEPGGEEAATSRRAAMAEVTDTPEKDDLTDALVEARLLVTGQTDGGTAVLNVAHEALLREWPRLREWIERNRAFLQTRARVQERAARWDEEGRPEDLLLPTGQPLAEARGLLEEREDALSDTSQTYIESSIERTERRERRRRRIIGGAVAAFVLVVAGFGLFSYQQWIAAAQERDESLRSQSQYLADAARQEVNEGDAMTGMLLALEALPRDLSTPGRPFVRDARNALLNAFHRNREESLFQSGASSYQEIRRGADGEYILAILSDGSAVVYDRLESRSVDTLEGSAPLTLGDVGSKGRFALAGANTLHLGTVEMGIERQATFDEPIRDLQLGPFGRSGVVLGKEGSAYVFRDTALVDTISVSGVIQHARFGKNANQLILAQSTGEKIEIVEYNLELEQVNPVFQAAVDRIRSLKVSPDRRWVAAVFQGNPYFLSARVWNMETWKVQREVRLENVPKGIPLLTFGPDGRIAFLPQKETPPLVEKAGTSVLQTPRIYNLSDRTSATLEGHETDVIDLAFRRNGKQIATLTEKGRVRLWTAEESQPVAEFVSTDKPTSLFWMQGEIVSSSQKQLRVWNGQAHPLDLKSVEGSARNLVVGPQGDHLGIVRETGIQFLEAPSGRSLLKRPYQNLDRKPPLKRESDGCIEPDCVQLTFGPTGRYAGILLDAEGQVNDFAAAFDLKTGEPLASFPWRADEKRQFVFSDQGDRVAGVNRAGQVEVFDLSEQRSLLKKKGDYTHAHFSLGGELLLAERKSGGTEAISISDGVRVWSRKDSVVAISPAGKTIVTKQDTSLVALNVRTGRKNFTLWESWTQTPGLSEGAVYGGSESQVISWDMPRIKIFQGSKEVCKKEVGGVTYYVSASSEGGNFVFVSAISTEAGGALIDVSNCTKRRLPISERELSYGGDVQAFLGRSKYFARSMLTKGISDKQTAVWRTDSWKKIGLLSHGLLDTPESLPYLWTREARGELHATYLWGIRGREVDRMVPLSTRREQIQDAHLDPKGRYAIAITDQSRVRMWPLFLNNPQRLIDSTRQAVTRALTSAQREQFNLSKEQ